MAAAEEWPFSAFRCGRRSRPLYVVLLKQGLGMLWFVGPMESFGLYRRILDLISAIAKA